MDQLEICCTKTDARLVLTMEPDARDFFSYDALIKSSEVSARLRVPDMGPKAWADFFADLSSNWRGWGGEKEKTSLEGHLTLTCTFDGKGGVEMVVWMKELYGDWQLFLKLHLEAGEQLSSLAREAKAFFGAN